MNLNTRIEALLKQFPDIKSLEIIKNKGFKSILEFTLKYLKNLKIIGSKHNFDNENDINSISSVIERNNQLFD